MTSKEALERYYSNLLCGNGGFDNDEEELEGLKVIYQDLERLEELENKNQKLKKAIFIIYMKTVDLEYLEDFFKLENGLETYNDSVSFLRALVNEEYELLKEVLGDE